MAVLFTFLIALQFLIIVSHDLIDIPGLVHGSHVQQIEGKRKVWLATLANSVFPGIAVAFAILFYNQPAPRYALRGQLLARLLRHRPGIGGCNVVSPILSRRVGETKARVPEDV
jgi:hypothetical protein